MKITQNIAINFNYEVHFTSNLFSIDNPLFNDILSPASQKKVKVAFVIDKNVNEYHRYLSKDIEAYLANHDHMELIGQPLIVLGGEQTKNTTTEFERVLAFINENKIDRHSYLVAIGGGAVLDMVGFAAAVGHRGIRHVRVPTTVLSQNDSGVGVKNGINYYGKKNFIGTFSPPVAVINDDHFLTSLDPRDWIAGTSEAIKVALIKDAQFFQWLEKNAIDISNGDTQLMTNLIYRCAELHCNHISQNKDPFELGSSRPLDFGHWAAHKLEQLSGFEMRHGEAVATGIALDVIYSEQIGLLDADSRNRVLKTLANLGFALFTPLLLDEAQMNVNPELLVGLEEFREHLGGLLTITLIDKIGHGVEVHTMDKDVINKSALRLREHQQSFVG